MKRAKDLELAKLHIEENIGKNVTQIHYDEFNDGFRYNLEGGARERFVAIETAPHLYEFEAYFCNPETGEHGWDIKFPEVTAFSILEAKKKLKEIPHFDCIILFNYSTAVK
jgi:hypothetical protein